MMINVHSNRWDGFYFKHVDRMFPYVLYLNSFGKKITKFHVLVRIPLKSLQVRAFDVFDGVQVDKSTHGDWQYYELDYDYWRNNLSVKMPITDAVATFYCEIISFDETPLTPLIRASIGPQDTGRGEDIVTAQDEDGNNLNVVTPFPAYVQGYTQDLGAAFIMRDETAGVLRQRKRFGSR